LAQVFVLVTHRPLLIPGLRLCQNPLPLIKSGEPITPTALDVVLKYLHPFQRTKKNIILANTLKYISGEIIAKVVRLNKSENKQIIHFYYNMIEYLNLENNTNI
jgi:hypothetical protein